MFIFNRQLTWSLGARGTRKKRLNLSLWLNYLSVTWVFWHILYTPEKKKGKRAKEENWEMFWHEKSVESCTFFFSSLLLLRHSPIVVLLDRKNDVVIYTPTNFAFRSPELSAEIELWTWAVLMHCAKKVLKIQKMFSGFRKYIYMTCLFKQVCNAHSKREERYVMFSNLFEAVQRTELWTSMTSDSTGIWEMAFTLFSVL